jgi:hypothetical protein
VFRYFVERYARRLGPSRAPAALPQSNRSEPSATVDYRPPRNPLDLSERKH